MWLRVGYSVPAIIVVIDDVNFNDDYNTMGPGARLFTRQKLVPGLERIIDVVLPHPFDAILSIIVRRVGLNDQLTVEAADCRPVAVVHIHARPP